MRNLDLRPCLRIAEPALIGFDGLRDLSNDDQATKADEQRPCAFAAGRPHYWPHASS